MIDILIMSSDQVHALHINWNGTTVVIRETSKAKKNHQQKINRIVHLYCLVCLLAH
jgi:hypothetical protein